MFNLSLAAGRFYFKKTNSREFDKILALNASLEVQTKDGAVHLQNTAELFKLFPTAPFILFTPSPCTLHIKKMHIRLVPCRCTGRICISWKFPHWILNIGLPAGT